MEHGLRLIAADLRSRGTARSIERIADQLEQGQSLSVAFASAGRQFPAFYGQLLEAGVRAPATCRECS